MSKCTNERDILADLEERELLRGELVAFVNIMNGRNLAWKKATPDGVTRNDPVWGSQDLGRVTVGYKKRTLRQMLTGAEPDAIYDVRSGWALRVKDLSDETELQPHDLLFAVLPTGQMIERIKYESSETSWPAVQDTNTVILPRAARIHLAQLQKELLS